MDLNDEWLNFKTNGISTFDKSDDKLKPLKAPKCSDIYISTKTKIAYINTEIDLYNIFWDIPIINYHTLSTGVVKKSIKINCTNKEETKNLNDIIQKQRRQINVDIITQRNMETDSKKYKDVRKVTLGLCKKDLLNFKKNKKSAFYNCFALIIRTMYKDTFKEVHLKIFNTGKLEIPGIQEDDLLYIVLDQLISILEPLCKKKIQYKKDTIQTVLINSNFNCGFYINRNKLFNTLKYKYNIHANYDPCSYPGIQCKFYYNPEERVEDGICRCKKKCDKKNKNKKCFDISFMIFRTGSILIVGMCETPTLMIVYNYLKRVLSEEYENIYISNNSETKEKDKKTKIRKKFIYITDKAN